MDGGGTVERPQWAPATIDITRPSAARVYDYFLGGSHNFPADRAVAEQALSVKPDLPEVMRQNRGFLQRTVCHLVEQGITQFLDIGSGIPTVGNVHEIAHALDPDVRVVYVDHDPVAVTHAHQLLTDERNVTALLGDLRDPGTFLDDPQLTGLIDFDRPLGLLVVAVLHFVFDADHPHDIVSRLRDRTAPGSYLAIEHATHDWMPAEARELLGVWNKNSPEPMQWRSKADITNFFGDFEIIEPGIVNVHLWRPDTSTPIDPNPERFAAYAGVAKKH
ncbi:SAM-dependent methyltransferase [Nocardia sp. BMG51109]|uniref:SAM-dependent methyltransferase n=1 Tax=Nocardia sp. BMG51109 TaxID=1056816 RepID=UPI0004B0467C|nr:SAM-dependent methyltransferase [Nocardia sp. BMG51109]